MRDKTRRQLNEYSNLIMWRREKKSRGGFEGPKPIKKTRDTLL